MITYRKACIIEYAKKVNVSSANSPHEKVLVHSVNCQGVMGSGIARQIKQAFPWAYDDYRKYYELNGKTAWKLLGTNCNSRGRGNLLISHLHSQSSYGKDGRRYVSYDALDECIEKLSKTYSKTHQLIMPKISAGLAGGSWPVIEGIINTHLKDHHVAVFVIS